MTNGDDGGDGGEAGGVAFAAAAAAAAEGAGAAADHPQLGWPEVSTANNLGDVGVESVDESCVAVQGIGCLELMVLVDLGDEQLVLIQQVLYAVQLLDPWPLLQRVSRASAGLSRHEVPTCPQPSIQSTSASNVHLVRHSELLAQIARGEWESRSRPFLHSI
eukprot:CAMPEP_0202349260 /NCGR_PEP_ID=MMETSP1126-20121109/6824_1 /ASSEMBLY_ACC=CAM_ASM_000457 /TAXON_ID=3047 /ORGANISM="Dunaliella tertiolecta, Strain CCMP1320" /LENGTH=161 /DNA_ID=CAMNT_0048941037 /DNA_START=884 /DNA_END=1370 /DNA_ORIENTATION=+